jgi:CubicO group peptidase (beta-lactamase class C family)
MFWIRVLGALAALVLVASAPIAAAQDLARLAALMERYHDAGKLNGAVLVARGDSVLYERGFGEADMEWGVPNAPDTRFRIGSVTKQFTAALVLQLVEEGRLALDGHVRDYLPEYPAETGGRLTVHHLLSHTGGVPNYTAQPGFMDGPARSTFTTDAFVATFSGLPLEFEPGTRFAYSNSGYFLLGALVERVTGQTYEAALRERILVPLGLTDTGYDRTGRILGRRAAGYRKAGTGYEHAAYLDDSIPHAAGMLYSTVRDLHRWTRALHAGRPFRRPETLARMTTPVLDGYAYGLGVADAPLGERTVRVVQHSGGINGFASMLTYLPDDGTTVVVLDNTEGEAGAAAHALTRALYGLPVDEPRRSVADAVGAAVEAEGVEAGAARYRALRAASPEAYDFGEGELNMLGYAYLQRGDVATAVRLFQLNVEAYPTASNPYDSLGEALLAAGDSAGAVANYGRSLELNPANENARAVLARLGAAPATAPAVVLTEAEAEAYVGRYALAPTFAIKVTRQGARLLAQATGQGANEIFPAGGDRFFLRVVDARLTFTRSAGAGGAVDGLVLHQGGRDAPAPRVE